MSPLGSVAVAIEAALWTVILAGMAPADVFNLKHLHHSPVVNYRFTTQNLPLSLDIFKYRPILKIFGRLLYFLKVSVSSR